MQKFDVLIVGAGPAGSSAAWKLAKTGASVLLIDKSTFPRYKPCGGGVSPQVQKWFDFDFSPVISCKAKEISMRLPDGHDIGVQLEDEYAVWMVKREEFDSFIVKKAVEAGADFRDGLEAVSFDFQEKEKCWQVRDSKGDTFSATYVIASDGAKGQTYKLLGIERPKKELAGALELEFCLGENLSDGNKKHTIYLDFSCLKGGYAWNFPKKNGMSLGGGALKAIGKQANLKQQVALYCNEFKQNAADAEHFAHPISLWDKKNVLHGKNCLLAGEAAALVDPLTAEGIRPSILSGLIAAASVFDALSGKSKSLEAYSEKIHSEIGEEMAWAKKISKILYWFPQATSKIILSKPSAKEHLLGVMTGKYRYQDFSQKALDRVKQQFNLFG